MCNANTDVYPHIWIDSIIDHPFPASNIEHKCRDFGSILEWQRRNALDEKEFVELRRPEGYEYRKTNHAFKELVHWFDIHEDDGDSMKLMLKVRNHFSLFLSQLHALPVW